MDNAFFERITLGNKEAQDFLRAYGTYIHLVDDVIDEKLDDEIKLISFVSARDVYTHPFFLKNPSLKMVDVLCTNAYSDCVAWEKSEVEWKRQWADHFRHFGSEMALAAIVAGGAGRGMST
jgi:hypothetical protein